MIVRGLDESGDIITRGRVFIDGSQAVAQTVVTRLRLFLGEYHLDIRDGTPWFQSILGKYDNMNVVESLIRKRISETEGVVRIRSFSTNLDFDERVLTVTCSIETKFGIEEISFNG